jgi:toxin ParE1/3/4
MAQIRWTEQALEDIEGIARFIERYAPRYAQIVTLRIFQAVERLEIFPLSGRIVPDVGDGNIREIFLGNYRIVYRVLSETIVQVLTVYHGARVLDPSLLN